MRGSKRGGSTPAEAPPRAVGLLLAALLATACSKAGPLDEVDAPRIVADEAEEWGFECPRGADGFEATTTLGSAGVVWFEADDVTREDEEGFSPGRFAVVEIWRGDVPDEVLVHWSQERQFDALLDDGARVLVGLAREGGDVRTVGLVGIAADGSIGVSGECGQIATAQLARIGLRYRYPDGESLLRSIIDDPSGVEAAALR